MPVFALCASHGSTLHHSSARLALWENEVAGLLSHGRFPKRASGFQNGHGAHSAMRDKGIKGGKKPMEWWSTLWATWLFAIGREEYERGWYFSEWAARGKINVRRWHMCKYARTGLVRELTRDDLRWILGYTLTVSLFHGERQAQPGVSRFAFTISVTWASLSLAGLPFWTHWMDSV